MKRKNYGNKIKRRKTNLYKKKKTEAQKTAAKVMLIILIIGIAVLGYCLGKPLLEYMGGMSENISISEETTTGE